MNNLTIIKIGGNIIDDEKKLSAFIAKLSKIKSQIILVHGGGKLATELSTKIGIETKMIEGRRITDFETLKVTTMVYAGWINKNITAQLNSKKINAIGICGADLFLMPGEKRKKTEIDYGFVGDVKEKEINTKALQFLLKNKILPVIAPITATKKGQLLNTNADTIASTLAVSLTKKYKVKLIYCFEKNGVLQNDKVIRKINPENYSDLKKNKVVKDGMIPKLDNAFNALNKGVKEVVIGNAMNINKLILSHAGTSIIK